MPISLTLLGYKLTSKPELTGAVQVEDKLHKCELPVQEIKTATELDLSNKGLVVVDVIVIAELIKVRITRAKSLGD